MDRKMRAKTRGLARWLCFDRPVILGQFPQELDVVEGSSQRPAPLVLVAVQPLAVDRIVKGGFLVRLCLDGLLVLALAQQPRQPLVAFVHQRPEIRIELCHEFRVVPPRRVRLFPNALAASSSMSC